MIPEDESLVRDYLLGSIASEGRDVIEARMLDEPDLVEQVDAIEGELIRDALRGELSPEDQARFDRCIFSNESLRRKYSLTRDLLIASGESATVLPALPFRVDQKPTKWDFNLWKLSFVAAAVALAFMTWQFVAIRSRLDEVPRRSVGGLPGRIVSLVLFPDVPRGNAPTASGASNAVQIPADASGIALNLQLEPTDTFTTYTVVVNNVDSGREVWGQTGLKSSGDGTQIVTMELPAHVLPPGDYTVLLETFERPSEPVVQAYSLRIPRN